MPREEAAPARAVCGEGKFKAFRNPEGALLRVMPGPAPPRQPAGKDAYPAAGREGLVLADSILATEQEAFIFLWAQLQDAFPPGTRRLEIGTMDFQPLLGWLLARPCGQGVSDVRGACVFIPSSYQSKAAAQR